MAGSGALHARDVAERALRTNRKTFEQLVVAARAAIEFGRPRQAAALAHAAAFYAWHNHGGQFASAELEDVVLQVARRTWSEPRTTSKLIGRRPPERILHVISWPSFMSGHMRVLVGWARHDSKRMHSVAVLSGHEVPDELGSAVRQRGGSLTMLTESSGPSGAASLRALAAKHDLVLLHTMPADLLPAIALATAPERPPVVYVGQADSLFWCGTSVADAVVVLDGRRAEHCARRRGFERDRIFQLSFPFVRRMRTLDRRAAKHSLGISDDTVVLLTVGAGYKYGYRTESPDDVTFLDLVVPVLRQVPAAALLAVGPHEDERWAAAREKTHGRVSALGPVADPLVHQCAADVYVDSYPVMSPTALLECASLETPAVAYAPDPENLFLVESHSLGLTSNALRLETPADVHEELFALVSDRARRDAEGRRLAAEIDRQFDAERFTRTLESFYASLPETPSGRVVDDDSTADTPVDRYLARVGSQQHGPAALADALARAVEEEWRDLTADRDEHARAARERLAVIEQLDRERRYERGRRWIRSR